MRAPALESGWTSPTTNAGACSQSVRTSEVVNIATISAASPAALESHRPRNAAVLRGFASAGRGPLLTRPRYPAGAKAVSPATPSGTGGTSGTAGTGAPPQNIATRREGATPVG